ncbi:Chaperone DnaJ-domain superfamily protein [Striga hermonthica]|uniref:Chaperone DnaJ-domain superfamily protein n=1 Tax=Striga hermonthica TaxID=68872 RepID=A0A9N7MJ09_STRHE|nr:Chaperone DnaJ-domain superfamily protein [Striga hermonthica]
MEHPFFTAGSATRAEAIRWLTIAEKLLSARDLLGSRSFATRARDADPTLSAADEILAVVDTLLAGDRRIGNNQPDFYSILRLTPPQGGDADLVADQYRSLVLHLNPQRNRFPFADQAFRLVVDAWSVLSNPSSKALYDKELGFFIPPHQPDPFTAPLPAFQQNFIFPQQPPVHGGGSSSVAATQFAPPQQVQVQLPPQVGPFVGGPTRVPQNFMGLQSGSNIGFGSVPSHAPVNNPIGSQGQENYSTFSGFYVDSSSSRAKQEQLIDKIKIRQSQQGYPIAGDKSNQRVCDNVQENIDNVEQNIEENVENVEVTMEEEEKVVEEETEYPPANNDALTFWTACPYCYYMYEYPSIYVDCTMRCQNCQMAFQCVVISSPPPVPDGQDAYFCCWGFIPLGFSIEAWKKNNPKGNKWNSRNSGPRVYIDDDEDVDIFADISSSSESDIDWRCGSTRKGRTKSSYVKRKAAGGTPNRRSRRKAAVQDGANRKQPNRIAKSLGKLDLNVELSNEAEERAQGVNKDNESARKEDDSTEGVGFFEGLDELFSNLPILNTVVDDKVVKAA